MTSSPILRERIARLETLIENQTTLLNNHLAHHIARDRWFLKILGGLVMGVVLLALPNIVKLLTMLL